MMVQAVMVEVAVVVEGAVAGVMQAVFLMPPRLMVVVPILVPQLHMQCVVLLFLYEPSGGGSLNRDDPRSAPRLQLSAAAAAKAADVVMVIGGGEAAGDISSPCCPPFPYSP